MVSFKDVTIILFLSSLLCYSVADGRAYQQNSLSAIQQRITSQGSINGQTLGDNKAWDYLSLGLSITGAGVQSLGLEQINFQITEQNNITELVVTGNGQVWNQDQVDVTLVLYFDQNSNLEFFFEFDLDSATAIPASLIPASASDWYNGLSLVGNNKVAVASATFTDLNKKTYQKGLVIVANVQTTSLFPAQKQLQQATDSSVVTGTITATFPLQSGEPLASFTLELDAPIYFGNADNIQVANFELDLKVSTTSPDASLKATIKATNVGGSTQTLTFPVTADLSNSGLTFNGAMQGTWSNAFGLSWLTFSNIQLSFAINPSSPNNADKFSFQGNANILFSATDSVSVSFETSLASNLQQVSVTLSTSLTSITDLFTKVIKEDPMLIDEVSATGQVQLTISTFSHDGFQPGLTISGNAKVTASGSIAAAIQAVTASSSLSFTLNLYVPVFSQNPEDINFALTETGSWKVTDSVVLNNINVKFTINPTPQVTLSTEIAAQLSQGADLTFDISAKINGASLVSLQGQLQGSWSQPFGLPWLTLKNVDTTIVFSNATLQSFNIGGEIDVQYVDLTSSDVTLSVQGPAFKDYSVTVEVFIQNTYDFLQGILEITPPALTSEISLMTSLTIATGASGSTKAGVTITGTALVDPSGKLATDIEAVDPGSSENYAVTLYIPVFARNVGDIDFSLSETGNIALTNNIQLTGFDIQIDITPTPQITLTTGATISLSQDTSALTFDLSAELQGTGSFSLTGDLKGTWNTPFGLSWLAITGLSAELGFQAKLVSLDFTGSATLTFSSSTSSLDINLQTGSNFKDVSFEIKDVTIANYGAVISATGNGVPKQVSSLNSLTNSVDVILSTYNYGSVTEGLTISDSVTITGDLLDRLDIFNANGKVGSMVFTLALNIPVFASQRFDVKIDLQTSAIPIHQNLALTGIKLEVDTSPLSISVETGCKVNFTNNPQLEFDVTGTYDADGSVILSGDMLGTWVNMFGIQGFSISNVDIAVGFNPDMCEVDYCLSNLGLGFNLSIGNTDVAFYGDVNLPDIEDIFLEGGIDGPDGMALSLQDIALEWNNLIGNEIHLPINVADIPADWGIEDVNFYIAPTAGTFNQIQYNSGFWIEGGFRLFGISCDVDVKVSGQDFDFGISVNISEFELRLHDELHWEEERQTISRHPLVKIHNVTLDNWSASYMAQGVNPRFSMDYNFLGHHHFSVGLPIVQLYDDFHSLWLAYLKDLFR